MFEPGHKPKKVTIFPGCTYCQPQVASVGLTERAAKEKGLKFKVGKFPFLASGKALAVGESRGLRQAPLSASRTAKSSARTSSAQKPPRLIAELGLAMTLEAT